jgi:hypothetical protein
LSANIYSEVLNPPNEIGIYSDLMNMKLTGLVQEQRVLNNYNPTTSTGDIVALVYRKDSNLNSLQYNIFLKHIIVLFRIK